MKEQYKRYLERQLYDPNDPTKQHSALSTTELFSSLLDEKLSKGISLTSKAYIKWCEIAGSRAASHTMAVWVNENNQKEYPDLIVYIDSSTLLADFTTNAELYKERLIYANFPVESIKFRLSNKVGKKKTIQPQTTQIKDIELPELTEQEKLYVQELCKNLNGSLQASASRAMELSLKVQKLENTRNNKPTA